jgi:hypothetical protein
LITISPTMPWSACACDGRRVTPPDNRGPLVTITSNVASGYILDPRDDPAEPLPPPAGGPQVIEGEAVRVLAVEPA